MSTKEIFKWQPANLIDWQEETAWRTIRTRMESGLVKVRRKWLRPRRNAVHVLIPFLELNEVDEIYEFFNARSGGYESFFLPSWARETRLSTTVTSGSTILFVEQSRMFTSTPNAHGYYVHLTSLRSFYVQQVVPVNTIINTFRIGVSTPILFTFPEKSWVQRAYLVRFGNDVFRRQRRGMNVYQVELQFEEAV